ncbi:T-cell-specific guanine nucleotide triphosphate-binding protein 2-like isoform X2 [Dreissena polymorpha]|uniref:T-cell-specific guanine nucleotide triphosphate-binding protein 2-like isoform X2 n=1 Tax=Dreissena polymorpha TaxID=45954 RepID=UPI0022650B92|nr:T-cell-specific guanine nucleotide triphosphate-binding protein 2-like isoform X2 [Dreissena polymorpha]
MKIACLKYLDSLSTLHVNSCVLFKQNSATLGHVCISHTGGTYHYLRCVQTCLSLTFFHEGIKLGPMASKSETIEIRCPSCKEEVKSTWKCCPHCETRLERPSCKTSTPSNLTKRPHSQTDNAVGSDWVNTAEQDADSDIWSDCVDDPIQDADNAVGSDVLNNPEHDADSDIWSYCVDDPIQDADNAVGSDVLNNPEYDAGFTEYLLVLEEAVRRKRVANLSNFTTDLNKWRECEIHIAIIGESGTGKSSFINAISGLQPGDRCSASALSSKSTKLSTRYPHPKHHNLVFWDLPGVGTPEFPKSIYLRAINFQNYDFFILVTATRFKEIDAWLATQIRHLQKKFYIIKSKIDFDVENDLKEFRGGVTKADIVACIRRNTTTELTNMGLKNPKLYLVNNKNINEYDFKELITQLKNDIPVLKKEKLILAMLS